MDRLDAIAIRVRQLHGKPVDAEQLTEALAVIAATNVPLTDNQFNERRRKLPKKDGAPRPPRVRKNAENLSIPVLTEENPAEVVEALRPWAVITPNTSLDPEAYVWPRPGDGVDIDAAHRDKP